MIIYYNPSLEKISIVNILMQIARQDIPNTKMLREIEGRPKTEVDIEMFPPFPKHISEMLEIVAESTPSELISEILKNIPPERREALLSQLAENSGGATSEREIVPRAPRTKRSKQHKSSSIIFIEGIKNFEQLIFPDQLELTAVERTPFDSSENYVIYGKSSISIESLRKISPSLGIEIQPIANPASFQWPENHIEISKGVSKFAPALHIPGPAPSHSQNGQARREADPLFEILHEVFSSAECTSSANDGWKKLLQRISDPKDGDPNILSADENKIEYSDRQIPNATLHCLTKSAFRMRRLRQRARVKTDID